MRRLVPTIIAIWAAMTAPAARAGAQGLAAQATTPSRAEQEVLDLSRTKWRWMADRKADSLAALFHEASVFVHMGGAWGRTQELDIIRSGGIHYKRAEVFEATARIVDATAIVLARIRLDAVVGGNEVSNPFFVTEVYVRQGGVWRLGALSFTRQVTPGT